MLSFGQPGFTTNRPEWIQLGGLGALGLSLPDLLATGTPSGGKKFGQAKSCIILFLGGGPSQHETFDPKPEAPLEIRGDFKSIGTSVPGMHFCELRRRSHVTLRLSEEDSFPESKRMRFCPKSVPKNCVGIRLRLFGLFR